MNSNHPTPDPMFTNTEASDGSAQPPLEICPTCNSRIAHRTECPDRDRLLEVEATARQRAGASDFRALLDSAKGVTADQLELQLARGHLKEAARAFEAVRAENNQLRNYMRVAGSLLGRADRDPVQLAAKIEAGIIEVNAALTAIREERDGLEGEAAKARRVIAGNLSSVEDSGSLLDMLNAVLSQASLDRANLAHADEKIRELQQFIASNAPQVSGSSGAL